jgi:hypothetical protein
MAFLIILYITDPAPVLLVIRVNRLGAFCINQVRPAPVDASETIQLNGYIFIGYIVQPEIKPVVLIVAAGFMFPVIGPSNQVIGL